MHLVAREYPAAAGDFERAIELDPRSFDAHYFYSRYLVTQARHAEAIEHYERAFAIDPDNYLPMILSMQERNAIGDTAGARSALERGWAAIERRLAVDPDDSACYDHGASCLVLLGRHDEASVFRDKALALRPLDGATHYNAACGASLAGDRGRALDLLERAANLGYGNYDWMINDSDLAPLHDEPRFQALAERLRPR